MYSRISNNRTAKSKGVIPFTCWAFKLILVIYHQFNNIKLSFLASHMKSSFPLCGTVIRYCKVAQLLLQRKHNKKMSSILYNDKLSQTTLWTASKSTIFASTAKLSFTTFHNYSIWGGCENWEFLGCGMVPWMQFMHWPSRITRGSFQRLRLLRQIRAFLILFCQCTVFENHRKKSHSTLRAKRATFTFWLDKSSLKMPKMVQFGEFLKT